MIDNGIISENFELSRGVRQGNPHFPFPRIVAKEFLRQAQGNKIAGAVCGVGEASRYSVKS